MKASQKSILVTLIFFLAICAGGMAQQALNPNTPESAEVFPSEKRFYALFLSLLSRTSPNVLPTRETQVEQPIRRVEYREMFQSGAQLTDAESSMLNQIARDSIEGMNDLDVRARQLISSMREKYGANGGAPPENAPERKQLEEVQHQRDTMVLNSIAQLRAGFGEAEFKRLDTYLLTQPNSRPTMPPPRDKQPLPTQSKLAFFDRQGETSRRQFSTQERFILQVTMRNNSAQTLMVTPANVFAWLQLYPMQEPQKINVLFKLRGDHVLADQPMKVLPNHDTIVARVVFGFGDIVFKPGPYRFALAPTAMLGHPPEESNWLALSFSQTEAFQIVP